MTAYKNLMEALYLTFIQRGLKEPYDWEEFAESFFPKARELASIAADAQTQGENDKASEYFLYVKRKS